MFVISVVVYGVNTARSVVENTTLADCNSSSFDVSADGDYVVNVFGNNSLGSFGSDNSSFLVDTSVPVVPPVVDGGSSGGGSVGVSAASARLEVDGVDVIISVGEEKSLVVNVKNVGRVSANKCTLISDGAFVETSDIFNIGVGEIVEFNFILSGAEGVSDLGMRVECLDDVSAVVPLDIVVWSPELDVSIEDIAFESKTELLVGYSIEPAESGDKVLYFRIIDSDGGIVKEVSQEVSLVFGESYVGEVLIDISDVAEGMLKVSIGDSDGVSFVEEDVIYGGSLVTGFSLFGLDTETSYIGILLVVFLIVGIVLVVRIWKLKKK